LSWLSTWLGVGLVRCGWPGLGLGLVWVGQRGSNFKARETVNILSVYVWAWYAYVWAMSRPGMVPVGQTCGTRPGMVPVGPCLGRVGQPRYQLGQTQARWAGLGTRPGRMDKLKYRLRNRQLPIGFGGPFGSTFSRTPYHFLPDGSCFSRTETVNLRNGKFGLFLSTFSNKVPFHTR
jgi:hypothetical protein